MKEQLQQILNSFDYEQALGWFKQHVPGKFFLKTMLGKGADPYNTQKLKEELFDILHSMPEDVLVIPSEKKPAPKENPETKDKPVVKLVKNAAKSIEEHHLDEEWKPLYKEANYYFAQLDVVKTDEERLELCEKILDQMDEVEQLWKKRDFVKQYGVSPDYEFQGMESMTIPQLITRRNTLRSYISKSKKGILNSEKLPEWEAEIAEVERRLKP